MSDVLSALRTAVVVIENLPDIPGYNGSILSIDDTEAERIAKDVRAGIDALEDVREERAQLRALVALIFSSTLPYNDGEPSFSDAVSDLWEKIKEKYGDVA